MKGLKVAAQIFMAAFFGLFIGCTDTLLSEPGNGDIQKMGSSGDNAGRPVVATNINLEASHGKKELITLDWKTYVAGVDKYRIFSSETPYAIGGVDGFELVAELSPRYAISSKDSDGNEIKSFAYTTSYDVVVNSGVSLYYKVIAYKKDKANGVYGDIIETSNIAFGTSLAAPILSITEGDGSADIVWFMDNCNNSTYKNRVKYEIIIGKGMANNEILNPVFRTSLSGADLTDQNEFTWDDFITGEKYYYEVQSYISDNQTEIETSGPLTVEDAKSIVPAKARITATRGAYANEIHVSWTLPPFTHVRGSDGKTNDVRPLYFVLQRRQDDGRVSDADLEKIYSSQNTGWDTVASYIGSERALQEDVAALGNSAQKALDDSSSKTKDTDYFFACNRSKSNKNAESVYEGGCYTANGSGHVDKLIVTMPTKDDYEDSNKPEKGLQNQTYPRYVYGAKVTFIDRTTDSVYPISRDKKYIYRIISKTDDPKKDMSGLKNSVTRGFSLASPSLYEESVNNASEDKDPAHSEEGQNRDITQCTVALRLELNTRDIPYRYLLVRKYTELGADSLATSLWNPVDCLNDTCQDGTCMRRAVFNTLEDFNSNERQSNGDISFEKYYQKDYSIKDFLDPTKGFGKIAFIDYRVIVLSKADSVSDSDAISLIESAKGTLMADDKSQVLSTDFGKNVDMNVIDVIESDNQGCVINNESCLPKIGYHTIEDGYNDKFVMRFEYKKDYAYTIKYQNCENGVPSGIYAGSINIPKNGAQDNGTVLDDEGSVISGMTVQRGSSGDVGSDELLLTYTDPATSGDERAYRLLVKSGATIRKTFYREGFNGKKVDDDGNSCVVDVAKTLGTPKIKQEDADYDSVTVSWSYTASANTYDVSAHYEGETEELTSATESINTTNKGTYSEKNTFYIKLKGGDDALIAGKKIIVKVTAKSNGDASTDEQKTSSTMEAYSIGPKALLAKVAQPASREMRITWKEFPENLVNKYVVYRVAYTDVSATVLDTTQISNGYSSQEKYLVEINDSKATVKSFDPTQGDCTGCVQAIPNPVNNTITLKDIFGDISTSPVGNQNLFRISQREIILGLPYAYLVFPILNENDITLSLTEEQGVGPKISVTMKNSNVEGAKSFSYKNLDKQIIKNATLGVGLNVHASKLLSPDKIKIDWEEPYWAQQNINDCPDEIKSELNTKNTAAVFRLSSTGWDKITQINTSKMTPAFSDNTIPADSREKPFLYCVIYGSAGNTSIQTFYTDKLAEDLEVNKKSEDDTETPGARYYYWRKDPTGKVMLEPKNKGYLLRLPNNPIRASTASNENNQDYYNAGTQYYAERVAITPWDYSKRYLSPKEYIVGIKNNNIDSSFHDVYKFVLDTATGNYNLFPVDDSDDDYNYYDLNGRLNDNANEKKKNGAEKCDVFATDESSMGKVPMNMWLSPRGIYNINQGGKITSYDCANNSYTAKSTGALKVLRDYRHYYRVSIAGNPLDGWVYKEKNEQGQDVLNRDYSSNTAFAYRNITDEELAKMTMLVLADVTCNIQGGHGTGTGGSIGRPTTEDLNKPGTGTFRWSQSSGSKFCWDIRDYQHKWGKLPGYGSQMDCFIKVTDKNYDDGGAYSSDVFAKPDASRGCKNATNWEYLTADPADHGLVVKSPEWELDKLINVTVVADDKIIPSEVIATYGGVVKFALNSEKALFNIDVKATGDNATLKYRIAENDTYRDVIIRWAPFRMSGSQFDKGNRESFDLGWWGPTSDSDW